MGGADGVDYSIDRSFIADIDRMEARVVSAWIDIEDMDNGAFGG